MVLDTVFNAGNPEIENLVLDIQVLIIYQNWVIQMSGEQNRAAYREYLKLQDKHYHLQQRLILFQDK